MFEAQYMRGGAEMPAWLTILPVITASCLFCWYIAPDRRSTPGKLQNLVARIWILLRRLISFSGVCVGALIIYVIWTSTESIGYKLISSLVVLAISFFFIYVGIVGQGWYQYAFSDDVNLYKKVKEKYGIRW